MAIRFSTKVRIVIVKPYYPSIDTELAPKASTLSLVKTQAIEQRMTTSSTEERSAQDSKDSLLGLGSLTTGSFDY